MFEGTTILIVEDEAFIALELAMAVEQHGGTVTGPFASTRKTLEILPDCTVSAAILDVQLSDRDVTPVALRLFEAGIPFVLHTATGTPEALAGIRPDIPVIMKPARPLDVLKRLRVEIDRMGGRSEP